MKTFFSITTLFLSLNINAQFVDKANEMGIDHIFNDFSHMGGGAVFLDYNNDGWEDLYITGGQDEDSLYKNKGDGTFEKATNIDLSLTKNFNTTAAISGDINNDGFRDLLVTTWSENQGSRSFARNLLYINNGNDTFTESGVAWGLNEKSFSMGASMLDYNNDGLLDLYIINYQEQLTTLTDPENGEVVGFEAKCYEDFFYENNGNNTFTEKAATLGINNDGCGLAVMPTDYNKDHNQDLYIANDYGAYNVPNTLYRNNSSGESFTNVSSETKTNTAIYAMGVSYADIDKDEDFDYYICNLGRNVLLKNDGNNVFTDIATSAGVENTFALNSNELLSTSWGTAFFDANNDTWPDLFVANGQMPAISFIGTGDIDPNYIYTNNGNGTFTPTKISVNDKNKGRGMAYADYDNDGDLDALVVVIMGNMGPGSGSTSGTTQRTTFFQNQLNPNGADDKNWVQFKLEGQTINRDAIGAKVVLTVNGEKLIQEVHGQGSHASQHSLILHFGLANNTTVSNVDIEWSNTSKQTFTNIPVNKRYNLKEGETLSTQNNLISIAEEITTFPNPIDKNLFIKNLEQASTIIISTINGKTILRKKLNKDQNLDLSHLNSGLYIVKIFNSKQNYKELVVKK